jgi:ABC-2 type transport system permease protein
MFTFAIIAGVFQNEAYNFLILLFSTSIYIFLWFFIFYIINYFGKQSNDQALKMISAWLLLCIIIPGTIHQFSSIKYPLNYMTEYIDVDRDKSNAIFQLPTDTVRIQLLRKFPFLEKTFFSKNLNVDKSVINRSISALVNIENKLISNKIENTNEEKNRFIKSFYLFNPVIAFQNRINSITGTDYYSYLKYRNLIQTIIDKKIELLLKETWNNVSVNKKIYTKYTENFK